MGLMGYGVQDLMFMPGWHKLSAQEKVYFKNLIKQYEESNIILSDLPEIKTYKKYERVPLEYKDPGYFKGRIWNVVRDMNHDNSEFQEFIFKYDLKSISMWEIRFAYSFKVLRNVEYNKVEDVWINNDTNSLAYNFDDDGVEYDDDDDWNSLYGRPTIPLSQELYENDKFISELMNWHDVAKERLKSEESEYNKKKQIYEEKKKEVDEKNEIISNLNKDIRDMNRPILQEWYDNLPEEQQDYIRLCLKFDKKREHHRYRVSDRDHKICQTMSIIFEED